MTLSFNQNFSDFFSHDRIESGMDFALRDLYNNEEYQLNEQDVFFSNKEESLLELFKTKSFSDFYESLNKQSTKKENNNCKEISPEYFSLNKIKEIIIENSPPDKYKEFDKKLFLETNLINIESNLKDQVLLGKKRKKKFKVNLNRNKKDDKGKNKKGEYSMRMRKHNKFCGDNQKNQIQIF